ncbi:hypothetical protein UFOVP732_52 [uncultured Caudovirales phage]|uniref:Uncharacterized protein n=1 Tax=uncultured Caudovirales phage TaxID=2100421 RepID=A0A6J5NNN0_9CAUD|nr:hypothetical protein UFOVP732_52 [uncultured Caudovirales phage]
MYNQPLPGLDPAGAAMPSSQEGPGFWQQLQTNGVLGMPVQEALLRFGSGLLSGQNWNEGLAQAGNSLVQGSQQSRVLQAQQAQADRRFKEQQALQGERIAAQERIAEANRRASTSREALTPFQRGGQVFRDPTTGAHYESVFDARSGASSLVPVGGGPALTGEALSTVQPRLVRASQEVTAGLNELQQSSARRYDEILGEGNRATSTIRDIDTALSVLTDPNTGQPRLATGQSVPARLVRGVSQFLGINVNGTTPERLDVLQAYLGNLNAEQRADLLRGLQPISNTEFQSANQALATIATDPNALVTLLQIQRSSAQRQADLAAALRNENVDELVRRGAVRSWEFDWRQRALQQGGGSRVEDTGNQQQPPRLAPAGTGGAPPAPTRPVAQGPGFNVTPASPAPTAAPPQTTAPAAAPPAPPPPSPAATPGTNPAMESLGMPPASPRAPQRTDFPPGWAGDRAYSQALSEWSRGQRPQR